MSISFDVNKKALQTMADKPQAINSIKAAFNGRTKSEVEACGANHSEVMGNFVEPSTAEMIADIKRYNKDETDPKIRNINERMIRTTPRVPSFSHAFMEAVHTSYADHYPLIITPDSVWLTIAQGFGHHVNANAEKLRKRFVQHEGKKLLMIRRDGFSKGSPNNDWPGCFSEFSDMISDHIGKKRDLIVSKFSTTGPIEKAASELVLMDSMKSYFKYGVMTLCGIPNITLTGTVEDWTDIRTRAENLAEYELDWWLKSLSPVLDQFVRAAEGKADIRFWDTMYKIDGGSGGPYCQGWVNTLFPYLQDYKGNITKNTFAEGWESNRGFMDGPTMSQYPNSLSKVAFKWDLYGANTYDMEFLAGLVGVHQDEKTLALESAVGWAVRDTGVSKPGGIDENEDW